MLAASIAISVSAFAVIAAMVGLLWYQARELADSRKDIDVAYVGHNDVVKSNFDLQLRVRTLSSDLDTTLISMTDLRDQLQREKTARLFIEDSLKKLVQDAAEKGDTAALQALVVQNLKKMDEIRRPPGLPLPAPPVSRKTPPETPAAKEAKTVPMDPSFLPPLPPMKKP